MISKNIPTIGDQSFEDLKQTTSTMWNIGAIATCSQCLVIASGGTILFHSSSDRGGKMWKLREGLVA